MNSYRLYYYTPWQNTLPQLAGRAPGQIYFCNFLDQDCLGDPSIPGTSSCAASFILLCLAPLTALHPLPFVVDGYGRLVIRNYGQNAIVLEKSRSVEYFNSLVIQTNATWNKNGTFRLLERQIHIPFTEGRISAESNGSKLGIREMQQPKDSVSPVILSRSICVDLRTGDLADYPMRRCCNRWSDNKLQIWFSGTLYSGYDLTSLMHVSLDFLEVGPLHGPHHMLHFPRCSSRLTRSTRSMAISSDSHGKGKQIPSICCCCCLADTPFFIFYFLFFL